MVMTTDDYDKDERWRKFAVEFIANGGVMTRACEAAGLQRDAAATAKKGNPNFVAWLDEIIKRKMASAMNKADILLADSVGKHKAVDSKLLKTQEQLYKRNDKLQKSVEIHNNPTFNQGEALASDVIRDLLTWAAEHPEAVGKLTFASRN